MHLNRRQLVQNLTALLDRRATWSYQCLQNSLYLVILVQASALFALSLIALPAILLWGRSQSKVRSETSIDDLYYWVVNDPISTKDIPRDGPQAPLSVAEMSSNNALISSAWFNPLNQNTLASGLLGPQCRRTKLNCLKQEQSQTNLFTSKHKIISESLDQRKQSNN